MRLREGRVRRMRITNKRRTPAASYGRAGKRPFLGIEERSFAERKTMGGRSPSPFAPRKISHTHAHAWVRPSCRSAARKVNQGNCSRRVSGVAFHCRLSLREKSALEQHRKTEAPFAERKTMGDRRSASAPLEYSLRIARGSAPALRALLFKICSHVPGQFSTEKA